MDFDRSGACTPNKNNSNSKRDIKNPNKLQSWKDSNLLFQY